MVGPKKHLEESSYKVPNIKVICKIVLVLWQSNIKTSMFEDKMVTFKRIFNTHETSCSTDNE